jgi:beta-glucosidase/6-phospho-beta-glucosidase/beta-galactosidase
MNDELALRSFFLGGFECSCQRRRNGKRLDLIAATGHDRFCEADYSRLREIGISSVRDGVRWHLIETSPYHYDFSSFLPMLKAGQKTGLQIIWDLFHYGWPDDLDLFSTEFIRRFRAFAREVARVVESEMDEAPYFAAVNEISFFAWAAGECAIFNPFARGRGNELKEQLVRVNIVAIDAIRSVAARARFVQPDPLINVVTSPEMDQADKQAAAVHERSQLDGWDMLSGRLRPELGGDSQYLDIIGVNYYVHNQWVYKGNFIEATDPRYRPLHDLLAEVYARYSRPLLITETGIEDDRRPEWLSYVCDEVIQAAETGVPVEGICLYPIIDYPGWDDDRCCRTGLWNYCDAAGHREIYGPLARELARQQNRIDRIRASRNARSNALRCFEFNHQQASVPF